MRGIIVKYDTGRRFGFIRTGDERADDIFFHASDVASGAEKLASGSSVTFEMGEGPKGPKAIFVVVSAKQTSPYQFYFGAAALIGALTFGLLRLYAHALSPLSDYLIAITLAAYVLTGFDKSVSGSGSMRVPENVLFSLAAAGGSFGLFFGMHSFRHKIRKPSFQFFLIAIFAAQLAVARISHVTMESFFRKNYHAGPEQKYFEP